nr:MAG TPA: hypothetical protein [Caudoviricetes sp.]
MVGGISRARSRIRAWNQHHRAAHSRIPPCPAPAGGRGH